jgi:hypothetical protein
MSLEVLVGMEVLERPPRAGDLSVCIGCGGLLVYTKEGELEVRKALFEDWQALSGAQRGLVRRAAKFIRRTRGLDKPQCG